MLRHNGDMEALDPVPSGRANGRRGGQAAGARGLQQRIGFMRVILAQPRGFCAGVVRAIEIVEQALERYGAQFVGQSPAWPQVCSPG